MNGKRAKALRKTVKEQKTIPSDVIYIDKPFMKVMMVMTGEGFKPKVYEAFHRTLGDCQRSLYQELKRLYYRNN